MEANENNVTTTLFESGKPPTLLQRIGMQVPLIGTAAQQMWAEQREDTAIQRQVADMKKAGINPILAYSGGGASSSAATAFNNGPSTMQTISSAISAKNANRTKKEIANDNMQLLEKINNIKTALELVKMLG